MAHGFLFSAEFPQCDFIKLILKVLVWGVPIVAQWKWIWLGTMRLRVQALASLSGLGIRRCCELWCGLQMQLRFGIAVAVAQAGSCNSNSTPSLGRSICHRYGPKKKTKKKKKFWFEENYFYYYLLLLFINFNNRLTQCLMTAYLRAEHTTILNVYLNNFLSL